MRVANHYNKRETEVSTTVVGCARVWTLGIKGRTFAAWRPRTAAWWRWSVISCTLKTRWKLALRPCGNERRKYIRGRGNSVKEAMVAKKQNKKHGTEMGNSNHLNEGEGL